MLCPYSTSAMKLDQLLPPACYSCPGAWGRGARCRVCRRPRWPPLEGSLVLFLVFEAPRLPSLAPALPCLSRSQRGWIRKG
jgi:hypothetical protein